MLDNSMGLAKVDSDFFSNEDIEILARDPASFVLTFLIVSGDLQPVNELYKKIPEPLHDLLDSMIGYLSKNGAMEIKESIIHISKKQFDENEAGRLSMFLPKVFELATKKILSTDLNVLKGTKEGVRYLVVPNDPEVSAELHALTKEYVAKINNVRIKSRTMNLKEDGHRMVGVFNYQLSVEDFV